jgi:DNA topoisomerase-1
MAKNQKTASKNKSLVIVESPAKAKTINKYLGSEYVVTASMGHVRDLPSKGISVDIENKFEPTYEITPGRKKMVATLKGLMKDCDNLYLATDLDREGEAIAWHLAEILKVSEDKTYRVIFNAITKNAILEAFSNPGKINLDKVNAQQARRILDRIVGYKISPLLWKKVARGLSAGRVQSVAVKIIVEREREIRAFEPKEYWLIPAVFTTEKKAGLGQLWKNFITDEDQDKGPTLAQQYQWLADNKAFKADLIKFNGEKFEVDNKEQSEKIYNIVKDAEFTITGLETKRSQSKSSAPFITSTLQQAAANRLGFSTSKTMSVAQQLYEGVELGSLGSLGLITYMRTDSTHLSKEAIDMVRKYIGSTFGEKYLPSTPNFYSASESAQAAHEAIRPTDVDLSPDDIREFLKPEQAKLYELIWKRFVACQMAPAQWDVTNVEITGKNASDTCLYRTSGRLLVFDGFARVWSTPTAEQQLPVLSEGKNVDLVDVVANQNFTKPPARYTEASLVKALEKEGIGRPSTYSSIISTIQQRKYVEQIDKKFNATDVGEVVTDKLNDYFPEIMDIAFTRHMEQQLDKIEEQHLDWVSVLDEFYGPFKKSLEHAGEDMKHAKAESTPSEYKCPQCEKELVYKFGKNGKFLSCSAYPECKFACPCDKDGKMIEQKESETKCPNCGKPMMNKSGRFGAFLGCSDYPQCKTILKIDKEGTVLPPAPPAEPTGIKCYKCKTGELVIRQSKRGPFMGCNKFPRCRTIVSGKMIDKLKDMQAKGTWPPENPDQLDEILERKKTKPSPKKDKK